MAETQSLVRGGIGAAAARARRGARALALSLALGACAAGGALPAPDGGAPGLAQTIAGADGAPLALSVWPAGGRPQAVLLAVHGFGDYAPSTFGGPAPFWAAAGIAVYAYDQRGFGRNPSRGAWPGADALIADFAAVAAQVRELHPDTPLIALGHSMGAGVALAAVAEGRAPQVDGLILAAPAIAGGDRVGAVSRAAVWTMAKLTPDTRWSGEGMVRFQASDDIDALRALAADPLYLRDPSAREILGLIRVMDRAAAAAPAAQVPMLALQGEKDELVAPEDSAAAAATFTAPTRTILYPEGWHLLFRDRQKARVWADVRDWILETAR